MRDSAPFSKCAEQQISGLLPVSLQLEAIFLYRYCHIPVTF